MVVARNEVQAALDWITEWARAKSDLHAVLLVGSHARGTARPDSDVDLVLLVEDKSVYLNDTKWTAGFGQVSRIEREEWGVLTSLRIFLGSGLEVEIGVATLDWAAFDPIDPGTERVIRDGAKILHDPHGLAARLIHAIR